MSQDAYATDPTSSEQVIVSPAQQAVNSALSTATTEVQQAIDATNTAAGLVTTAQTELSQASTAITQVTQSVTAAQTSVALVDTAITTISAADLITPLINQGSEIVNDAKETVVTAQTAINNINTTTAQTELTQAITARTAASTAQATAQTELTQANIAIDNAQTAVNNLQATIGTTTNVLAGVDDAGIRMNLPFGLQMGGTLYNNVYVGSNATITFGVDEGWVYYTTPNAPSVSIAGWDWTTWSTGTGITYSTTGTSLDIAWDVRPYPQWDASTQMVQIRFNADVNPTDGAWMANVTATGPIPNGARFNYRPTTNGTITPIEDTNTGSGFAGQISQGAAFTPYVDPNISTVQASVDAANAVILQLNQSLSPVVTQNTLNTSAINTINTTSLTNTLNTAILTKTNLQSQLDTKSAALTAAISLLPEVQEPQSAPQPQPEPIFVEVPDFQPKPVEQLPEPSPDEPVQEETQPTPEPETEPEQDSEDVLEPSPEPELTPDDSSEISLEEQDSIVNDLTDDGQISDSDAEAILESLDADGETTQEEVVNLAETLAEDGVLTEAERDLIAEALIASADGEAVTAEAIAEAGLEYSDLPPETPVEVRQDENGNQVIITAEVASALQLLESPAALISGIFSCITPQDVTAELTEQQKCEVLAALANIGADMSPEEREEATKMVVATVIASGAALNAVGAATATRTGGSTGGGAPSGGSSGGTSESKGIRRRRET